MPYRHHDINWDEYDYRSVPLRDTRTVRAKIEQRAKLLPPPLNDDLDDSFYSKMMDTLLST